MERFHGTRHYIDQIRARLQLSNVLGRYVVLKSRGNGEYTGVCPFHQEKTPSFTVSDSKQFYHCFGCGAHGDVISFLQNFLQLSYGEVLEKLAAEAGVELPLRRARPNAGGGENENFEMHHKILECTAHIYQSNLHDKVGQDALFYLKHRGLTDYVIQKYGIGYATPGRNLIQSALEKHFTLSAILDSGVLRKSSKTNKVYDPFTGRIIFPIFSENAKVVGFGGRTLDQKAEQSMHSNDSVAQTTTSAYRSAKYINSAESIIFNKGSTLYGLSMVRALFRARKQSSTDGNNVHDDDSTISVHPYIHELVREKTIVVVEGYLDVLTLAAHGIENVVAPLGTALKSEQIQLLWRYSKNPIICLDNDQAGIAAMERIAHNALPCIEPEKTLRFLRLDRAKDPADFVQQYGAEEFAKLIKNNTVGLADFIFHTTVADMGHVNTPETKAELHGKLMLNAGHIQDAQLRNEYRKHFNTLYAEFLYPKHTKYGVHDNFRYSDSHNTQNPSWTKKRMAGTWWKMKSDASHTHYNPCTSLLQHTTIADTKKENDYVTLQIDGVVAHVIMHYSIAMMLYTIIKFPIVLKNTTVLSSISTLTFKCSILDEWRDCVIWYVEGNLALTYSANHTDQDLYEVMLYCAEHITNNDEILRQRTQKYAGTIRRLLHALEGSIALHGKKDAVLELIKGRDVDAACNVTLHLLKIHENYMICQQIAEIERTLFESSTGDKRAMNVEEAIANSGDAAVENVLGVVQHRCVMGNDNKSDIAELYNTLVTFKKQQAQIQREIRQYHGF